jgi:hypothetical protein
VAAILRAISPLFAHPGHHHAARAAKHQFHGAFEGLGHWTANPVCQRPQRFGLNPHHVLAGMFHADMLDEGRSDDGPRDEGLFGQ